MDPVPIPYCGPAPGPADWLGRWNLDPWLIAALFAAAAAFALAQRGRGHGPGGGAAAFHAGIALLAVAFVSPLCALAVALFSARVFQHLLVLLVAAPLLAYGASSVSRARASGRAAGGPGPPVHGRAFTLPLAVAFAALFVGWHLPGPYERTFASDATFWAMHASLLVAALPFWAAVLRATRSRRSSPDALPAIAFVAMAMGLLGAVLTFAPAALYAPHAATTAAYGRSALEDQQLGGLVMWVPGSATLLVAAIAVAVQLARRGTESVVPSSSSPST